MAWKVLRSTDALFALKAAGPSRPSAHGSAPRPPTRPCARARPARPRRAQCAARSAHPPTCQPTCQARAGAVDPTEAMSITSFGGSSSSVCRSPRGEKRRRVPDFEIARCLAYRCVSAARNLVLESVACHAWRPTLQGYLLVASDAMSKAVQCPTSSHRLLDVRPLQVRGAGARDCDLLGQLQRLLLRRLRRALLVRGLGVRLLFLYSCVSIPIHALSPVLFVPASPYI